jgi:hypothetical protein
MAGKNTGKSNTLRSNAGPGRNSESARLRAVQNGPNAAPIAANSASDIIIHAPNVNGKPGVNGKEGQLRFMKMDLSNVPGF